MSEKVQEGSKRLNALDIDASSARPRKVTGKVFVFRLHPGFQLDASRESGHEEKALERHFHS